MWGVAHTRILSLVRTVIVFEEGTWQINLKYPDLFMHLMGQFHLKDNCRYHKDYNGNKILKS